MAVTPNKGLAQQASGTSPWDATLNQDDFGRIDSAMTDTQTMNLTLNTTTPLLLTNTFPIVSTPLSSASYIPKRIGLTGNVTQATTIQVPSGIKGWWIVGNYTNGAFPVYFGNAGGGAVVQTMPNADIPIYCNGTDAIMIGGFSKPQQLAQAGDLKASASPYDQTGWLVCDGRSLLRASYPALFTAIGGIYGSVDGTHFNIPDCRGRAVVASDDQGTLGSAGRLPSWTIGSVGGASGVSLTADQNGTHTHGDSGHGHPGSTQDAHQHGYVNVGSGTGIGYGAGLQNVNAVTSWAQPNIYIATGYASIQNSGSGNPHLNVQPSLAVHWLIYTGL